MSTPTASLPDATTDDDAFVRSLVKTSRQRTVHLRWTDRDGSARLTPLAPPEATRLNALARARSLSAEALLRDVAHQATRHA
jgi:capsid protein